MTQHAIVLFPRFDDPGEVESVRRDFDPLATVLAAHVTLVFPFAEAIGLGDLREHVVAATEGTEPFDITLASPTIEEYGYLFLRVVNGRERIVELHDRLYSDRLARHLSLAHVYDPHVTVGRFETREQLEAAVLGVQARLAHSLRARIESVAAFQLDGENGVTAFTVPLDGREISEP